MVVPTQLVWMTGNQFLERIPKLKSLDLYCLDGISYQDALQIKRLVDAYSAKGKRASFEQFN